MKNAFHVHSFRCGHAEEVSDEEYIKTAIALGAREIWFTDHAPFPGDPFGARMRLDDLAEYVPTLTALREKYPDIKIHIGLETEYFPVFDSEGYYKRLKEEYGIEMLLLGQHMAQISSGPPVRYSFSQSTEVLEKNEFRQLGEAIALGIKSGYFGAVAHPDRIFRRCSEWTEEMDMISDKIIQAAFDADIPLEINLSSLEDPRFYRTRFWKRLKGIEKTIIGLDAHYISELKNRFTNADSLAGNILEIIGLKQ